MHTILEEREDLIKHDHKFARIKILSIRRSSAWRDDLHKLKDKEFKAFINPARNSPWHALYFFTVDNPHMEDLVTVDYVCIAGAKFKIIEELEAE